jgi:hypothetical protein
MSAGDIIIVWEMPFKSQEFAHGPKLEIYFDRLILLLDYEIESGGYKWLRLNFSRVVAFSFTVFGFCTVEQIKSYDRLSKVAESPWLEELFSRAMTKPSTGANHYRIFFDEIGCYEIAAESFDIADG